MNMEILFLDDDDLLREREYNVGSSFDKNIWCNTNFIATPYRVA